MTLRTGWNNNQILMTENELEELKKAQEELERKEEELKAQLGEQIEYTDLETTPSEINISGDGVSHERLYDAYIKNEQDLANVNHQISTLESQVFDDMIESGELQPNERGQYPIPDNHEVIVDNYWKNRGNYDYSNYKAQQKDLQDQKDSLVQLIEFEAPIESKTNITPQDVVNEAIKKNPSRYYGMSDADIYKDIQANTNVDEIVKPPSTVDTWNQQLRQFYEGLQGNFVPWMGSLMYDMLYPDKGGLTEDMTILPKFRNSIKNQFDGTRDATFARHGISPAAEKVNKYFAGMEDRMDVDKVKNKHALYDLEIKDVVELMTKHPDLTFSEAVTSIRNSDTAPSQQPNSLARWIVGQKEYFADKTFEYLKNNPEAMAVREYMAGNKLSDMKPGYIAQTFAAVFPSIATTKLSGILTGLANMSLTAGRGAPGVVLSYLRGQMFGEGVSGGIMEGAFHFGSAYDYLITPQPISQEDYILDKGRKEEQFKKEGLYFDYDLGKQLTPEERLNDYLSRNYMLMDEEIPVYYASGNMVDEIPKTNIMKKGLRPDLAIETAALPALGVGIINGIIETFSTKHFFEGATNYNLNDMIGFKWYFKAMESIEDYARLRAPGQTILASFGKNIPEGVTRLVTNGFIEGTEEVLQGFVDESMGAAVWSNEPFDYGFEEIAENFIGGVAGAGITGFNMYSSAGLGIAERKRNFMLKNMGYQEGIIAFHADENDEGSYSVYYQGSKGPDKVTGTFYNEETGRWEDYTEGGEGMTVLGGEKFPDNYDNFRDAFRTAELMTEYYKTWDEKTTAWDFRKYLGGSVSVVEIEDEDGTTKYSVNAFDSKGELIHTLKTFDDKYEAKAQTKIYEDNISAVNKLIEKYGGIEKLSEDPDINTSQTDSENSQKNQGKSQTLEEEMGTDKDIPFIAVKSFMGLYDGKEGAKTQSILDVDLKDLNRNPEIIKDIVRNNPDQIHRILDDLNVSPEEFVRKFDEYFDGNAGELTNLMPSKADLEGIHRADIAIKAFMQYTFKDEKSGEIADEIINEGLFENPDIIKGYIKDYPDSPIIREYGQEEIQGIFQTIWQDDALEFPERPVTPVGEEVPIKDEEIIKEEVPVKDEEIIEKDVPPERPKGKVKKSPVEGMSLEEVESYAAEQEKIIAEGKPETMPVVTAKNRLKIAKKKIAELKKGFKPTGKIEEMSLEEVLEFIKKQGRILLAEKSEDTPAAKEALRKVELAHKRRDELQKKRLKRVIKTTRKEISEMSEAELKQFIKDAEISMAMDFTDTKLLNVMRQELGIPVTAIEAGSEMGQTTGEYVDEKIELAEKRLGEVPKARIEISKEERKVLDVKERKKELISRLDMLLEKFQGKIKYKIFDTQNDNVLRLKDEQGVPESAEAWYNPKNKTIYVISDMAALSAPFHEFAHPFVEEIRINNPELYYKLYNDIIATKEGQQLLSQVSLKYTEANLDFDTDSDSFKDEIIVFSLETLTDNRYAPQSKFMKTVRRIWDSILEFLFGKSFMNNIYASELSPKTTLDELAKILADDKGRYSISLDDPDFTSIMNIADEVVQENTDNKNLISNIGSVLTDGVLAGGNAISNLTNELQDKLVLAISKKKNISKALSEFIDEANERYNLNIGEYKDETFIGEYKPVTEARDVIIREIESNIKKALPEGEKLPEDIMEKLQKVFTEVEGRISFRYKLIDNVLNQEKYIGKKINIKDLPSQNGVKGSREEKFVQKFIDEHWNKKFPGIKSALSHEIIEEYQEWADSYFPVYSSKVSGYESSLKYSQLFDKDKIPAKSLTLSATLDAEFSAGNWDVHRIMLHNGTIYSEPEDMELEQGYIHQMTFPSDIKKVSGHGYGWYTVLKLPNGDIFLHEYQTDLLPELKKTIKEIEIERKTDKDLALTKGEVVKRWLRDSKREIGRQARSAVISLFDLISLKGKVIPNMVGRDKLKVDFVNTKLSYSRKDLKYYLKKNPFIIKGANRYSMVEFIEGASISIIKAIAQYNKANNLSLEDETSIFNLVSDIIKNDLTISSTGDNLDTYYEEIGNNMATEERHFGGVQDSDFVKIRNISRGNAMIKIAEAFLSKGSQINTDVHKFYRFYYKTPGIFSSLSNEDVLKMMENHGFSDNYVYKILKNELNNFEKSLGKYSDPSFHLGQPISGEFSFRVSSFISDTIVRIDIFLLHQPTNLQNKIRTGKSLNEGDLFFLSGNIKRIKGNTVKHIDDIKFLDKKLSAREFFLNNIGWFEGDIGKIGKDTIEQLFPILVKRYMLEYMSVRLANNTVFNAIKNVGMDEFIKEDEIDDTFIDAIYENALNNPEIEQALQIDNKWFPTLLLHSFTHSRYLSGDNKIYLSTGVANTLIQGSSTASGLYSDKEEAVWSTLKRYYFDVERGAFISNAPLSNLITEAINNWYDSLPADSSLRNNDNVIALKNGQLNSLKALFYSNYGLITGTVSRSEMVNQPGLIEQNEKLLLGLGSVIKKIQDGIVKNIMDTSLESYKSDAKKFIDSWITEESVIAGHPKGLSAASLAKIPEVVAKERKRRYDRFISQFSRLQDVLSNAKIGVWRKALDKLAKKHGIKIKIVQPDFANAPLIEITLPEKGELNPPRFKIPIDRSADEKFVPHSEEQIDANIRRKLSYFEDYRTMSREFVVGLLDDAWAHMNRLARARLGRKGRVDLDEFSAAMIDVLPEELHNFYEEWFKDKFQDTKDRAYKKKSTDKGAKYSWLDSEDIIGEAISMADEQGIREGLNDLVEKGMSDEKTLGLNERLYFKELKIMIEETQYSRMRAAARQYNTFDSWLNFVLPVILKKTTKISKDTENGLKKYYNRINSTLKTNGNIEMVDGKKKGAPNQRYNIVVKKKADSIEIEIKGPKNILTLNSNNQFEKMTLFERNVAKNIFYFIKGKDVLNIKETKDNLGRTVTSPEVSYNFFNKKEMLVLLNALAGKDLTIAFARGSDDTLGIVKVKQEHKDIAKDADALMKYWIKELQTVYDTQSQFDEMFKNLTKGTEFQIAAAIARHQAMKLVWPNYLVENAKKGAGNIFKRIALPFTPVTVSHEMPSYRVVNFNPNDVMFVYGDGKPFSPIKVIPGLGKVYIGDGNSLTSQALFDLFYKFHGLSKGTAKAKTVIYHLDESGNMIAIKHEHVLPKKNWKITDKDGNVLFTIDKNRNIKDANGDPVHMLVTPDEAKVWESKSSDVMLPGISLGFIKYDETSPKFTKHGVQWYNHVFDEGIFNAYQENYLPILDNEIRNLFRLSLPGTTYGPSEYIAGFLTKKLREDAGYIPTVIEHAKLGAGLHPSMSGWLNTLLQTQLLKPAIHFDKSNGSRYEISMDVTGTLGENEVSLSRKNSRMVEQAYADFYNISLSDVMSLPIEEINDWLTENVIEVAVTRYPVPHNGGVYIARVMSLHDRKGLSDLNHIDVKVKLEGDGDGDEVQIELLAPEVLEVYKDYIRNLKVKPINLSKYSSKKKYDITNYTEIIDLIYKSTSGTKAIAEIANVQLIYGIMANLFSHIRVSGMRLRLKQPDEIVKWDVMYDGKLGRNITVAEFLRTYLQGALDNAEYGVLGEWGYGPIEVFGKPSGLDKIWMMLFEIDQDGYKADLKPDVHFGKFKLIKKLINLHKEAADIRRGWNHNEGAFTLSTMIGKSQRYHSLIKNNRVGLINTIAEYGMSVEFIDDMVASRLLPLEQIAIATSRIFEEMDAKYNLFGYEISPFILTQNVHENAHADAMRYIEDITENLLEKALGRDKQLGNLKWSKDERRKGYNYTTQMIKEFYEELQKIKTLGSQTLDRSEDFIAFKEKFHSIFQGLSNTAQVAATIQFLRGYMKLSDKIDKFHKTNFPKVIPPVSKTKGEYSLLSPSVMEEFFRAYNDNAVENRKSDKLAKLPTYEILDRLLEDICGRKM